LFSSLYAQETRGGPHLLREPHGLSTISTCVENASPSACVGPGCRVGPHSISSARHPRVRRPLCSAARPKGPAAASRARDTQGPTRCLVSHLRHTDHDQCAELTQDEEQENMATIIGQQWLKILLIKYEKYENSKSGQTLGSKTLGYALVFIPEVLGYFTYMSKLIT